MSPDITLVKVDETNVLIRTNATGIHYEISENFKYRVPNYYFMPSYRSKIWDGYYRIYQPNKRLFPVGIIPELIYFITESGYTYTTEGFTLNNDIPPMEHSEIIEFSKMIELPLTPRDYQCKAVSDAIHLGRSVIVSATGSGKSLIIYLLLRYYNEKSLVIVPNISLVNQLYSDFLDYQPTGDYVQRYVFKQHGGKKPPDDHHVLISTWQSLMNKPDSYFKQFRVVIGDEAHQCEAKELKSIVERCVDAPNKFATTGTIKDSKTHKLILKGLFGQIIKVNETYKLIQDGVLSKLKIKQLRLTYPKNLNQLALRLTYFGQKELLIKNPARTKFIAGLTDKLNGNTLVLFSTIDHGKVIWRELKSITTKPMYWVSGSTESEQREQIRKIVETSPNAVILATEQVFAQGINIKRLDNLVLAFSSKSKVRILQSIGRVLRKSDQSDVAVVYDIYDDLTGRRGKSNYFLHHAKIRQELYEKEKFSVKDIEIPIECHISERDRKLLIQNFQKILISPSKKRAKVINK